MILLCLYFLGFDMLLLAGRLVGCSLSSWSAFAKFKFELKEYILFLNIVNELLLN